MTAAGAQDASLPPAPSARPARREPRNFLSAGEHRRLFWRVMPPALALVVAIELLTREAGPPSPPSPPQVDTRIEAVAGPPLEEDEVVILPAAASSMLTDESPRSASPPSLARVRDASFFGRADRDAWLETFLTLQGEDGRQLAPPRDVGFTELFGQPEAFRGLPVRMRGTLRRLERLRSPRNDYGIEDYWQGWLEPAGGPASPVIVHCLELPAGLGTGLEIDEPVVVAGAFLKNMAYRASDGVRVAPLILSRSLSRPPSPPAAETGKRIWDLSLVILGVGTMLAIVAGVGLGFLTSGRWRRRRPESAGLDASLAGFEPVSVAESLRRMAANDWPHGGGDDQREAS